MSELQGVVLQSARDQRIWAWVTSQADMAACGKALKAVLASGRMGYPGNVAKELGLVPPDSLKAEPDAGTSSGQ